MNFVERVLLWLAAAGILFLIGFGGGYYTKGKFDQAAIVKQVQKTRQQDAENALISQEKSKHIAGEVASINSNVDSMKKEIKKYAPKRKVAHAKRAAARPTASVAGTGLRSPREKTAVGSDRSFVSRGELWVLDRARLGLPADPAPFRSDEEGRSPSDLSRAELLDGDLEVVKRYNVLAKRHNALVDYVEELQRKQADKHQLDPR